MGGHPVHKGVIRVHAYGSVDLQSGGLTVRCLLPVIGTPQLITALTDSPGALR